MRGAAGKRGYGRRILQGMVGLAMGVVLTAQAEVRIAVGLQPGSLPIFVAEAQGYFAAEGVSVRRLDCAFGKICLRMAMDGQAHIATVADLPIVLAAHTGQRFGVLATINTNRNDTKIVTRRGSGVTRVTDLEGRSVGLHLGTTAQFALDTLLVLEGVDPDRVRKVDLKPGEGRERLLARTIDAAALFEPYAYEAARALGADAVVLGTGRIYKQTWNLVAAGGPDTPLAPAEVDALLRALNRACEWIYRRPAEAKALLRERTGIDADLVEASWESLDFELRLDQSLITLFEGQSRWAVRQGAVPPGMPNFLGYLKTAPLRRVRPGGVTIAE